VFIGVVLSAIAAFLAALNKMKGDSNSRKIDTNIALTKAGTEATVEHAKVAAVTATAAAEKASEMSNRLNGALDDKVRCIVKEYVDPLVAKFNSHIEQDDKNMREIRDALGELRDRIPAKVK
jgi:hypothetical protein